MGPHSAPHLVHAESLWIHWFKDGILNPDIDDAGVLSVLHYLADLNVLEYQPGRNLRLTGIKEGVMADEVKNYLHNSLDDLRVTKGGFAIVYFLSCFSEEKPPPLKLENSSPQQERKSFFGKNISSGKTKSSDLSNLQIVKKWGDQLRTYLDLEQQTIARLRGKYTSQEDAQWLFSYILNKTRQQAPAKKWEQVSRKKHR